MRKINFYYIVVAVSAMTLSVSSCTKDLKDDVDQLKKEVAENKSAIEALDQAIKKGALITDVKPITGGFTITFSDNKTINVMNGAAGSNGAAGEAGKDGFAPILSVDSEGYWTIVRVKGGAPERFTVGGKELKAVLSVPSIGENGNWFIDGVDTKLPSKGVDGKSPYINTVEADGVVGNWMIWSDADGKFVDSGRTSQGADGDANVEVKEDGYLWIGGEKTSIGNIPAVMYDELHNTVIVTIEGENYTLPTLPKMEDMIQGMIRSISVPRSGEYGITLVSGVAAKTFTGGVFDGAITEGQALVSATIPVLVNPSNVELDVTKISIVNQKDEKYPVKVVATEYGAVFTRATPNNGLRTLILAADGELPSAGTATDLLAVKVMGSKGAVYSSYDYKITTEAATDLTNSFANMSYNNRIGTSVVFSAKSPATALYSIDPATIYKSKIVLHKDDAKYADNLEITDNGVKAKTDAASITALDGKTVKFVYTVIDFNGASKSYPNGVYDQAKDVVVSITFYNSTTAPSYDLPAVNHTLSAILTSYVDLKTLFDQLGTAETAIWKTNATQLTVTITDKNNVPAVGIAGTIVDASDGNVTVGANAAKIKFTVVNGTVLPGSYKAVLTFKDSRNTNTETFKVNVPVTISNPTLILDRITGMFVGNKLTVYGDTQDQPTANTYTLEKAYNAHSYMALAFEEVDAAGDPVLPSSITTGKVAITTTNMNIPMFVKVTGTLFGNNANTIEETIIVTPKSSIANGKMSIVASKKLELVYDQAASSGTSVKLSEVLSMTDAETKAVKFLTTTNDDRLATVSVQATGSNKDFIKITETAGDQVVTINYNTQGYNGNELTIPIVVTLTDQYGEEYVKSFDFKVKPKA